MRSAKHQKTSTLLVSIKYLMVALGMLVLFMLKDFLCHTKGFQLTGHY